MSNQQNKMPDIVVRDQGTVVMFTPTSKVGRDWIQENVQSDDWQWMGRSLVVDHRYAQGLIDGMQRDGLSGRVL